MRPLSAPDLCVHDRRTDRRDQEDDRSEVLSLVADDRPRSSPTRFWRTVRRSFRCARSTADGSPVWLGCAVFAADGRERAGRRPRAADGRRRRPDASSLRGGARQPLDLPALPRGLPVGGALRRGTPPRVRCQSGADRAESARRPFCARERGPKTSIVRSSRRLRPHPDRAGGAATPTRHSGTSGPSSSTRSDSARRSRKLAVPNGADAPPRGSAGAAPRRVRSPRRSARKLAVLRRADRPEGQRKEMETVVREILIAFFPQILVRQSARAVAAARDRNPDARSRRLPVTVREDGKAPPRRFSRERRRSDPLQLPELNGGVDVRSTRRNGSGKRPPPSRSPHRVLRGRLRPAARGGSRRMPTFRCRDGTW
jgi:hypothetical protein